MREPTATTARAAEAAADALAGLQPRTSASRSRVAGTVGAAGRAFDGYAAASGGTGLVVLDRRRVRAARITAKALRLVADGLRQPAPGRIRAGRQGLDAATRLAMAWQGQVGRLTVRWKLVPPAWTAQLTGSLQRLLHATQVIPFAAMEPGATGSQVVLLQRRLAALGYLSAGYATGEYDYGTLQAVIAFQGWEGLTQDGIAGPLTLARLRNARAPAPWSTAGQHIEIHIAQQVLLLVTGGRVVRAIHVSTAAPGHVTPHGTFAIYRKERMSWSVPFQVWMPYANYFTGGYAIHEYPDVPPYPASHGCVRVPVGDSIVVWNFATLGTPVTIA